MKRILAFCAFCLLVLAATGAEKVKVLTGTAVYYGESSESPTVCKAKALEQARLNALEREYGKSVRQDIFSDDRLNGDKESNYFQIMSATEVKGEWIEDIDEPKYKVDFDKETGNLIVECTVKFKARALTNESYDFEAQVLRCQPSLECADTRFISGESMYMYFKAPANGYVAVYLAAEDGYVYTLLPYLSNTSDYVEVKKDKEYVFFSPEHSKKEVVDEMQLCTDEELERNQVYIFFSPKKFNKAMDVHMGENIPRRLSFKDFSTWMSSCVRRDPKMGRKMIPITIVSN